MFNFVWKKKDISEDITEIIRLKNHIKLTEAMKRINHLLTLKNLRSEDRLALAVLKTEILNIMGRHVKTITLAENEEQKVSDKSTYKNNSILVRFLLNVAIAHLSVGNHEKAQQAIDYARNLLNDIENPSILLQTELMDARLRMSQAQLSLALERLSELTDVQKLLKFPDKSVKTRILIELGLAHFLKGEIHQASAILSQISFKDLESPEAIHDKIRHAIALSETLFMQLEHEKARHLLQEAITLAQTLQNKYLEARALFTLIVQLVDLNEAEEAEALAKQLHEIASRARHPKIEKWAVIAEGLILKLSKRALKLAKSQEIFFKLQNDALLDQHERILVKTRLAELLLIELQSFGNMQIFSELIDLLKQLQENEIAKVSFSWQVELKLLQSKIQLLEAKYGEAKQALNDALHVAHAAGLKKLAVEVSTQIDVLDDEMEAWQKSNDIQRYLSIEERIAQSQLKNIVLKMIKKRIEDIPHLKPEKPEAFLIMEESGQILFSHNFNPEKRFNEQLIGGFLAAINSFSKETFSASGSIERIKHQEHTLLLNAEKNLFFCYIFQGQSYSALEKLSSFIKMIKKDPTIWETLTTWIPTTTLPSQVEERMKQLVMTLFSTSRP